MSPRQFCNSQFWSTSISRTSWIFASTIRSILRKDVFSSWPRARGQTQSEGIGTTRIWSRSFSNLTGWSFTILTGWLVSWIHTGNDAVLFTAVKAKPFKNKIKKRQERSAEPLSSSCQILSTICPQSRCHCFSSFLFHFARVKIMSFNEFTWLACSWPLFPAAGMNRRVWILFYTLA